MSLEVLKEKITLVQFPRKYALVYAFLVNVLMGICFSGTTWGQLVEDDWIDLGRNTQTSPEIVVARNGQVYFSIGTWYGDYKLGAVLKLSEHGQNAEYLHVFDENTGKYPDQLMEGSDGNLYGITKAGGVHDKGTIFRLTPNGTFTQLHSFNDRKGNIWTQQAKMIEKSPGKFIGLAEWGGEYGFGIVFEYDLIKGFTVLSSIARPIELENPLTIGADGKIYGSCRSVWGSPEFREANKDITYGYIFRLNENIELDILYKFNKEEDSVSPSPLTLSEDGFLYGVSSSSCSIINGDSSSYCFNIFRVFTSGVVEKMYIGELPDEERRISNIKRSNGLSIIEYSPGEFYVPIAGNIFRFDNNWQFGFIGQQGVIGSVDGGFALGKDGYLYMVHGGGGKWNRGGIYRTNKMPGHKESYDPRVDNMELVYSLTSNAHGDGPEGGILESQDGYFYGAATRGGRHGYGSIYKFTGYEDFELVYSFEGGSKGYTPVGNLVEDNEGNIYGLVDSGGEYWDGQLNNNGGIFRLSQNKEYKLVVSFDGENLIRPYKTSLMIANDGNLYGISPMGGQYNDGCIYRYIPDQDVEILHSFNSENGGSWPSGSLFHAKDNFLYGATVNYYDSETDGSHDFGSIFKVSLEGNLTTVHVFRRSDLSSHGGYPEEGPIMASNGYLYGGLYDFGPGRGGAIYSLSPSREFKVIHAYDREKPEGGLHPGSKLFEDSRGFIMGTTDGDRRLCNSSTVFEISRDNTYNQIRSPIYEFFNNCNYRFPGAYELPRPLSSIHEGSDGRYYFTGESFSSDSPGFVAIYKERGNNTGVFRRGDCNQDGDFDISDVIETLSFLFIDGEYPQCENSCDVNDDEALDISDPISGLSILFLGQGRNPFTQCCYRDGFSTNGSKLSCEIYSGCDC